MFDINIIGNAVDSFVIYNYLFKNEFEKHQINQINNVLMFQFQLATTLAKQLIQLRKTKTRNMAATGKITAIGHQATAMQATHKMAGSMQVASKVWWDDFT